MGLGLDNPLHLLIILLVVLLLFGAKRLPDMGRSLGEGMRGFKDAITGNERPSLMESSTPAAPPEQEPAPEPAKATANAAATERSKTDA